MKVSAEALAQSNRTIQSYEDYADRYDALVAKAPHGDDAAILRQLAEIAGPGGHVLEVGSGPGRDADFLETLGLAVRRTDATRRFIELQTARGKNAELLNIITDEFGGPYDGVVALYVLFHIPREQIDRVLAKVAASLRPGGAFLVSMREGTGEIAGKYHTVCWRRDEFAARLDAAGLATISKAFSVDSDGVPWNTFLTGKLS